MKKILALLTLLLCLSASTRPARAAASASWFDGPTGRKWVRLENDFVRLDFAPEQGARGAALLDKKTGQNWVPNPAARGGGGLFMDHFWEQSWPGEFLGATYHAEVLPLAPDGSASARFSITATGKWGSNDSPLLSGLELTRTVTLLADTPVMQVNIQIHNPTTASKVCGYWLQNVLWVGGDKENDVYLRPNSRQTSRLGYNWKTKTPILGFLENEFERAPTAGWTAALDEKTNSGMAFTMDYGPLMNLYNSLQDSTVEWQYVQTAIPPGKTWGTNVTAILFNGFKGIEYATPQVLFNTQFSIQPDALEIAVCAARGAQPVDALRCELKVLKLQSRREIALPDVEWKNLGRDAMTKTVRLPGVFTEPITLKVTAHVQSGEETRREYFEVFYGSNLGFAGVNRTIDLPPLYPLPAQPRDVKFLKPDVIERVRGARPKVLVVEGQNSQSWQVENAVKAWDAELRTSEFAQASAIAANVTYWPVDYTDLMSYDAIVLANLDASALSLFAQEMLRDYVLHGGGLVVLGGMNTLGNGHFAEARFADILPVEPGGAFEIRPLKNKEIIVQDAPEFAALSGKIVNFAHLLKPRAGARVLASAGEAPLLVTGQAGEGRVAVVGATTLGSAPPDETMLWTDAAWPPTLARIIRWAAGR